MSHQDLPAVQRGAPLCGIKIARGLRVDPAPQARRTQIVGERAVHRRRVLGEIRHL